MRLAHLGSRLSVRSGRSPRSPPPRRPRRATGPGLPAGRAVRRRLLALPARLAVQAGGHAERSDPGVPLPPAPGRPHQAVGQRHLPPGRLGGRATRTGCPTSSSTSVADLPDYTVPQFVTGDPAWVDYTVEVEDQAAVGPALRRRRLPLPDQQAPLPVRAGRRQGGAPGGARPHRQGLPHGGLARHRAASPSAYETNKKYYLIRIENEGPSIRVLHRRQAGHRGQGRRAQGRQGRPGRQLRPPASRRSRSAPARRPSRPSTPPSASASRSWPGCAPTTPSPRCGRSSPPPSSGPGATCASATSTATARPTC